MGSISDILSSVFWWKQWACTVLCFLSVLTVLLRHTLFYFRKNMMALLIIFIIIQNCLLTYIWSFPGGYLSFIISLIWTMVSVVSKLFCSEFGITSSWLDPWVGAILFWGCYGLLIVILHGLHYYNVRIPQLIGVTTTVKYLGLLLRNSKRDLGQTTQFLRQMLSLYPRIFLRKIMPSSQKPFPTKRFWTL